MGLSPGIPAIPDFHHPPAARDQDLLESIGPERLTKGQMPRSSFPEVVICILIGLYGDAKCSGVTHTP